MSNSQRGFSAVVLAFSKERFRGGRTSAGKAKTVKAGMWKLLLFSGENRSVVFLFVRGNAKSVLAPKAFPLRR